MEFNIVKIKNSFNRHGSPSEEEIQVDKNSTINFDKNTIEINSNSINSLTADYSKDQFFPSTNNKTDKHSIIRDIIIGTICSALGSIITYIIISFL